MRCVERFALLACIVFGLHLLHHARLGVDVLSAQMMPYTLLYTFGIGYPAVILLTLRYVKQYPAMGPLAVFVEQAFPVFMALIAVALSVLSAGNQQGVTTYPVMMMLISVLLQGQYLLVVGLVLFSWGALAVALVLLLGVPWLSPEIAISFTAALACIMVANMTECSRITQFELQQKLHSENRQLQRLSNQDHLTGLLNRRALDRTLEQEIARSERFGHALSILMLDVDNFKHINDSLGHVQGDEVLKSIAHCLQQHVRDVDFVGRLGGDEFIVILIETDKRHALQVAERMRQQVSKIPMVAGLPTLTVSVGHAQFEGESLIALIERADKALYQAKQKGKDRVQMARAVVSSVRT
ncbi:GGDEF domain-containing protein [Aestuariibacter halophilus]|uniref:diguanylate cyclase n=1 Tax=Fluctibacter halophilus TaxID=226011 RepID=A0ABS8GBE7_9ALTE|nr:GGDEF domain-containing protein [Aestuariibacter halophilus]MCC2617912.1 GGDEF domain-containing protein [Aestuariibacter halophilus]